MSGARPAAGHPPDHEPWWLFLRQEMREGDILVDVFYCARCLGRIECEATGSPVPPDRADARRRGPLQVLGSAARGEHPGEIRLSGRGVR